MAQLKAILAEQFDDLDQQQEAATAGMWIFLATEILFFGGLFLAYIVYRHTYPAAFAVGSHHSDVMLGTVNTALLLTSSFTMALAVRSSQLGQNLFLAIFLTVTIFFGLGFLALKGLEYSHHIADHLAPGSGFRPDLAKPVQIFFWLYFVMTGLHALHLLIGVGVLCAMLVLALRHKFSPQYYNPIEISGLYWHFVDIVWVFLYPLFYLIHS